MLAHEPVPVVAALRVVLADADHAPGERDLLEPGRVGPQRTPAGLHDGGAGRRGGEVDQPGDRPGVPALAEQSAGADEHLAWPSSKNRVTHGTQSRLVQGPSSRRRASSRTTRSARRRDVRPEPGAACRPSRATVVPVTRRGCRCRTRTVRGARARAAPSRPASSTTPRRSTGRVAAARSWSQSTSIRSRSPRLRCSTCTIWVSASVLASLRASTRSTGLRPRTDAAPGQLVADRRQHRADPRRRPRRRAPVRAQVLHPALDQQHPVVGGRGVPVGLGEPGAVGQREQTRRAPSAGRRVLLRVVARLQSAPEPASSQPKNDVEPYAGSLSAVVSSANRSPCVGEPLVLGWRRRGQPGELGERCEVPLADHGRDADAEDDVAEQLVDEPLLVRGQGARRRRGEAEHEGVRQLDEQLLEQPAPDLQQVVALVEDQREVADRLEPLDERAAVRVQGVQQRAVGVPVLEGSSVLEGGQGLVGQRREGCLDLARVPAPGSPPYSSQPRSHCDAIAVFGPSATVVRPRRRAVSSPTSVLPAPGGRTTQARRSPLASAFSMAVSAARWWTRSGYGVPPAPPPPCANPPHSGPSPAPYPQIRQAV